MSVHLTTVARLAWGDMATEGGTCMSLQLKPLLGLAFPSHCPHSLISCILATAWGELKFSMPVEGGWHLLSCRTAIPLNCSEQEHLYSPFWEILCSRQHFLWDVTLNLHPPPPLSWQAGDNSKYCLTLHCWNENWHVCKQQTTITPPQRKSHSKTPLDSPFWTAFDLCVGKLWGAMPSLSGFNPSKHLLDW